MLARELGIDSLHYLYPNMRRGFVSAWLRYPAQALQTWQALRRERPRLIFVQSPPTLAVLSVLAYAQRSGARYIVDAHSAAFQQWFWTRPRRLWAWTLQRAVVTLVTNAHFAAQVQQHGGQALIVRDIPTHFCVGSYPVRGAFKIAVVNTFSPDEPLPEILRAAAALPDIQFYVTGKRKHAPAEVFRQTPFNVQFTDFLPDASYYGLLANADAVMCLTTRDHTMQRGACEALSLGRPIITSDWSLLRDYFSRGTVHVANTAAEIQRGVVEMRAQHARYAAEIRALQAAQQQEWHAARRALLQSMSEALAARPAAALPETSSELLP